MNGMSLKYIECALWGNSSVLGNSDGIFGYVSKLYSKLDDYRKTLARTNLIPESNNACYLQRSGSSLAISLSSVSVFNVICGDNCIVNFNDTRDFTVLIFDSFGNIDLFEGNNSSIQRIFNHGIYKIIRL